MNLKNKRCSSNLWRTIFWSKDFVDIFLKFCLIFDWIFPSLSRWVLTFNYQITCTSNYLISHQKLSIKFNSFLQSVTSRLFGRVLYRFGCPNSGTHKTLVKFSLFRCISKKICWSSNQWLHNASNYFEMVCKTKMKTEEKTIGQKMLKWKKKFSTKAFSFI